MQTDSSNDAAQVRFPPPLVYLLGVMVGVLAGRWLPLPWPHDLGQALDALAALTLAIGVALLITSLAHFARTRQNPEPWKPTPELIVEGVYRWTRNPMYLGMSLIQLGIGVALDNAWIVLLVAVTSFLVARIAIAPEERYLGEKFGDSYRVYQQRVGRWFGRRAA